MKKKFTLLIFAILASLGAMASPPQQDEGNVAKWNGTEYATLQEALDAAEATNPEHIVIDLLANATLDIKAWDGTKNSLSIGTVDTKSITLNGGNYSLNFVQHDSDWNNVATMNDAQTKLILNDMIITNSGYNNGPWNRHDINFNCAVELNNVTSDKALAFKNSATLKNVKISDTSGDIYGIWISPQVEGQTISIDGLDLTMAGGRAIKIDDEYKVNPPIVQLDINNATFTSKNKSAIIVKNKAGATITAGDNIDISNVTSDTQNLVWIDEDYPDTYSIVSVTGGTKIIEGSIAKIGDKFYSSIADAVAAASAGDVIEIFKAGTYTLPGISKNVTIEGTVDGVEFTHTTAGNVASIPNGATFKNLTFNFGNVDYHGFQQAGTINMEDCTLNGKFFSYGDMNFTNCEFNHSGDYHMWTYAGNITYTGCTFTNETKGKFLNVYNDQGIDPAYTVKVTDCKFINKGESSKAALNVKATYTDPNKVQHEIAYDVTITNCTTEGAFPAETITQSLVVLNNLAQVDDRTATGVDYITVTHDGVQIYPLAPVAKIGEIGYPTLQLALDAAHEMTGDVTVQLVADITEYAIARQKADLNLTIEGKEGEANHTITGQIIIDGDGRSTGTETLTIQNIAFTGNQTNFCSGTTAFIIVPSTKDSGTPYYTNKYNYAHNITVDGCSFVSSSESLDLKAVETTSGAGCYNLVVSNSTGSNLHSFSQLAGTTGATYSKVSLTNSDSFLNYNGGAGEVNVSECNFTSTVDDGYAIRLKSNSSATINLTDNNFTASKAVQLGKNDETGGSINVISGTYVGDIVDTTTGNSTGKIVISGGHFSAPIYEDAYAGFIVENKVGKKDLYVDETPEAPNGIGDPIYVAQIGENKYTSLQKAVDAAYTMTGDVTIELIDDITEYALVKQKENLNLTIDGKDGEENHKIIGQIFIDGMGRNTGAETLTITNVKFEAGNFYSGTDAFINVPSTKTTGTPWYDKNHNNHAHNITVSNCTFTGAENTNTAVAIRTNSGTDGSTNLTFVNNTAANLHSFAQLTAVAGMSITGNVVSATGSFVNISGGNAGDAVFTGNKFISAKLKNNNYAVRVKGSSAATVSLVDNEFDAPYIVQYGDGSKLTQNLSIESGIYVGDIIFDAADGTTGKIAISGGHFSAPLGDSEYAAFIAEGKSGVNGIYLSETPEAPNGIGDAVATLKTGDKTTNYASLEAAFADAIDGSTITLLKDCAGNGIKVPEGKFHGSNGLIVDFGGHTYTVDGTTVGSAGTETQAFQLLKDNYIFFTNGTIYSEKALFLVQNYSDLTLEDMTLTLNNENYASGYTLSNNNGNITIIGSTINANTGGGFAFDVCRYSSYPSVSVTVAGESVINGDVEVSASGSDAKEGFTLTLDDGKINGNLVLDESAKAAMAATPELAIIRERDSFGQPAPEGYMWQSEGNGNSILVPAVYVAQIGDVKYTSLAKAVAAVPADGTETTITMIDNEMINVVGYAVTIPATKNIVLDLNGYQIVGTVDQEGTSALIRNLGTLTIKDSSDTNADGTGTGKLMSGASSTWTWDGTDDYSGSYASNLIRNEKDLIVESGYLYNMSLGSAAYAIDNYSAGNITIKGGKVDAAKASAIRMFYVDGGSVTVKGGDIGHYVSDDDCSYMGIQVMSGKNVNVSITDGTIAGLYALYANNTGGIIDISGGTFDGYVGIGAVVPNISISGGAYTSWVGTWGEQTKFVSGGIYAEEDIDEEIIADGYIFTDNTDEATKDVYPYMVRPAAYVAQNVQTKTKYETIEEAVAVVDNGQTIKLLADVAMAENLIAKKSFTIKTEGHKFNPAGNTITIAQTGVTVNVEIAASIIDNFDSSVDGFKVEETVIANGYAYSLVPVEDLDLATIEEGYYNIKNVGNSKYVNVKGRKTATVDASEATSAGTVIKVKATEGKVEILRSQAVDIPSYAQRAMRYVPEVVTLVVDKLGVDGSGKILGETGVDAILEKFYDEFDPNLYVENVDGGYRIFGRTPSMQPVLDFYKENKANVDAKLPELEQAVNDAIALVVDKLRMGTSLKDSFKLHTIWERMGATNLTEPVDDASKLLFLQEVLSSKNHVWNFAYQTATFYADEVEGKLDQIEGISEDMDVSKYIELAKKIRPDFKYYIVQNEDKMDIISEGNIDIINNADRAVWQIEAAETMTVNVPEENSRIVGATFDENGKRTGFETGYYTTLYTDFAYQLPEGVVALKVTEIKDAMLGDEPLTYESGDATLTLGLLVTEEIGQEVPAQTPVLIMSKTAGDIDITIGDDFGASADVADNLLHGADYLIEQYEINTPALEGLFDMVKEKVSSDLTDKYEHLIRKNSGTVNNKFFFSLNINEELANAYKKKTGNEMKTSPVLTLSKLSGKKLAFNESWDNIQPNSVILVSEETKPALFTLTGDVTRDGIINVRDVSGQVNIIQERDEAAFNYDYDAANIVDDDTYNVRDVSGLVNIIQGRAKHPDLP